VPRGYRTGTTYPYHELCICHQRNFLLNQVNMCLCVSESCLPARFATLPRSTTIVAATSPTGPSKALSEVAARTLYLGPGLVHFQRAPRQIGAVQSSNSLLGSARIGHFYKSKPSGSAGIAVCDDVDILHLSVDREHVSQLRFGGAVGQ